MDSEDSATEPSAEETLNTSSTSKTSDENVDAIKKFIEDQDIEIELGKEDIGIDKNKNESISKKKSSELTEDVIDTLSKDNGEGIDNVLECHKEVDETIMVASNVIDMIISETEHKLDQKKDDKVRLLSPGFSKGGCSLAQGISLTVGSKVEVKDFSDEWYPAEVMELDYDELEVLVRYEIDLKKHDEWVNVNSPRLRPTTGPTTKLASVSSEPTPSTSTSTTPIPTTKPNPKGKVVEEESEVLVEIKEEIKEEKGKPVFVEGERCLARWRDNRRFIATIVKDLGDGKYEIVFDDGFAWTCSISRLHKWRGASAGKADSLTVDTSQSPAAGPQSPIHFGTGPSTQSPVYNTHLFDPARDYLSSKSERREMKRKINIKEIFNIGQKKQKIQKNEKPKVVMEKKPRILKRSLKLKRPKTEVKSEVKEEVKMEIPDAVASIIGTIKKEDPEVKTETPTETSTDQEIPEDNDVATMEVEPNEVEARDETVTETIVEEQKSDNSEGDPVLKEDVLLEKFDNTDDNHEEVIDKIKEVISKLENGINESMKADSPKIELSDLIPESASQDTQEEEENIEIITVNPENFEDDNKEVPKEEVVCDEINEEVHKKKDVPKVKKGKKLRLLQEKKVKKQVEKVKSELEEMKRQFEEMRQQMLMKTQELSQNNDTGSTVMPESFLLPGEWCCKWVNGQPVGKVSEIEAEPKLDANNKPVLPRRSVQVEDKRLPPGWTKHMVRRSVGNSAGKWDVVLVSPENKRFHTKTDMRHYLEANPNEDLQPYLHAIMDFGVHLKLARRMGWITNTPDGVAEAPATILPAKSLLGSLSPLVKKSSLGLKKKIVKKEKRRPIKLKLQRGLHSQNYNSELMSNDAEQPPVPEEVVEPLEDGYVYVGSLKVQVIENLLRCPAEGCFKNFRNNTLIKMHIKHYHRELRKQLGATPKVLDLASARSTPPIPDHMRPDKKVIKVKLPKPPKREEPKIEIKPDAFEPPPEIPTTPTQEEPLPKCQDSPKLRHALIKPVKRPRVLLPVKRMEAEQAIPDSLQSEFDNLEPLVEVPMLDPALDFETAISTHTVTKPLDKKKKDKTKKSFAQFSKTVSEDEEWFTTMNSDELETQSSFPRSGTPDSKIMDGKMAPMSSESANEEPRDSNLYTYTETGERVKIVHMKREEIINCHCGFREEDGLMVQCELCLCWQHALCHNILNEASVPEKYTCSICLNPRRGRRSKRFLHDQDRMYEGVLAGSGPCGALRRSHELAGNLLRLSDALHALRVKYYVATKKDHPKLYLWAKDWEQAEITYTQEKLNSDYSDLSIMINGMDKENMPVKDDAHTPLGLRTPPSDELDDRYNPQRDIQLGSQSLLSGLLSSPGGASLDLPISTSELERLAKSVQAEAAAEWQRVCAPQPEAAIENDVCRERLLQHIQRCQALIDTRLDSIEAQVAELESQDPSFGEHYETAEFYPRTKQTVQMLMRDLDTMEELGVIT